MTIAKRARRQTKPERIQAHVQEMKRAIRANFPDAEFEFGPVPESRWPGLWVYCAVDVVGDVTDSLDEMREDFFIRENMDIHVIVLEPRRSD